LEPKTLSDLKRLSINGQDRPALEGVPRPRFRWGTRVVVPVLVVGGVLALFAATAYETVAPAIEVTVESVIMKTVKGPMTGKVTVQAAGWIEADPYKSYVPALADGIVREVLVLEGESVKKNQVVVRLVDVDARLALEAAEARVREIKAAVTSAKADLEAAKEEWENPVERTRAVEVAQASLKEARAELEQISAQTLIEEARLEHAKSEYKRVVPLHRSKAVADSHLVRVRSEYSAQEAGLKAARSKSAVTKARIARCEADVKAAKEHMRLRTEERRRLDLAEATLLKIQASLRRGMIKRDAARLRLARMEVRAPSAGVVMNRHAEPGSKLTRLSDDPLSAHVLTLYDPARLQVRVDVPLADAAKIGVEQAAEIVAEVLPDRVFSGTVTRVLHEADIQKNTLQVKVAISDPSPELRPEMLARVRFMGQIRQGGEGEGESLFAPARAVSKGPGTKRTWVLKDFDGKRGIAIRRDVRPGRIRISGWIQVLEGLRPGDLVITQSRGELKNNGRVKVIGESSPGE